MVQQVKSYKCSKCGTIDDFNIISEDLHDKTNSYRVCNKCTHQKLEWIMYRSPWYKIGWHKVEIPPEPEYIEF